MGELRVDRFHKDNGVKVEGVSATHGLEQFTPETTIQTIGGFLSIIFDLDGNGSAWVDRRPYRFHSEFWANAETECEVCEPLHAVG